MNWAQDLRFATRLLRKHPWFSAAIVVMLALGIGVNTTIFTLVNAVLYKPLPFPGGERLVVVQGRNLARGRGTQPLSYPDFRDYRAAANSFEFFEGVIPQPMDISERGNPPQRYRGARTTPALFRMIRVQPVIGRGFTEVDGKPGAAPVALLGYGVWKDRYGRDPHIIGRTVRINEKPVTLIGVMPEGFKFPNNEDVWLALVPDAPLEKRDNLRLLAIGMLKPAVSISQAAAELSTVSRRIAKEFPGAGKDAAVTVQTFQQTFNGGRIRLVFLLMLAAVGFVLLIACANVANMMLSRALTRSREISIRATLGAGRWHIIRQLLIESVLLSVTGGLLGLAMAHSGVKAFSLAVADVGKPYWIDFTMDYLVFAYFAAISVAAGILFGLAPALQASKTDVNQTLKEGGRTAGTLRGGWLSGALVVFQFSLALVLLSGAGLMMRSFLEHQSESRFIPADRILAARLNLPSARYPKPEERRRFFDLLLPRLNAIPGANSVALVSNPPGMGAAGWTFEVEGNPNTGDKKHPSAAGVVASPGYFQTVNIALLRGRDFNQTDGLPGKEAAIVTQTFASRFWPHNDPIGKRFRIWEDDKPKAWLTIVGVTRDVRQNNPIDGVEDPVIFVPYQQESYSGMTLLLRTQPDASALAAPLRAQVQSLDEDLPLSGVELLSESIQRDRWYLRVFGSLFLIFAAIAMLMAAVGIYAVMSQATIRRTQEIGIRIALGADIPDILRLVLGRGMKQLALGMALGLAAALAACGLMASLLFHVSPRDPVTFAAVVAVLAAAGLLACWLPARRAAALHPLKALHYE
ncbi:MAG: ABC transporter permease [Bryobacterales bacterium]|nr:ABC transporter permease [Bryobacterales bacterium]